MNHSIDKVRVCTDCGVHFYDEFYPDAPCIDCGKVGCARCGICCKRWKRTRDATSEDGDDHCRDCDRPSDDCVCSVGERGCV